MNRVYRSVPLWFYMFNSPRELVCFFMQLQVYKQENLWFNLYNLSVRVKLGDN